MALTLIVALFLVLSSRALESDLSRAVSRNLFSTSVRRLFVPAICLALAGTFAARIAIDESAASTAPGIPLGVILDQHVSGNASDLAMLVACLQTALLVGLAVVVGIRRLARWETIVFGLTTATMMLLSVHAPVVRSTDLYSYVGYAHLGASAYDPVARPFPGSFHAIDRVAGSPLVPSPYGPVWLAISRAIVSTGSDIASQLTAFRFFSVGLVAAVLVILRLRKVPVLVLVLAAVDPEIYEQYVIDGHNDLWALLLILTATLVSRYTFIGVALVAVAVAIKISFALPGLVVFSTRSTLAGRIGLAMVAVLSGLVLSLALGRYDYIHALTSEATRRPFLGTFFDLVHLTSIALCLVIVATAVIFRRYVPGGNWTFLSQGVLPFPWYTFWGFDFALRSGTARTMLILFPLVGALLSSAYTLTPLRWVLLIALVMILGGYAVRTVSQRGAVRSAVN